MLALLYLNFAAMFDFFFKKRSAAKSELPRLQAANNEQAETASAAAKFAHKQTEKQAQLARAAQFDGQEDAAVAFILQSDFADARFLAVQHIHSQAALVQVIQAMRNADRRVSKFALEQLTILQKHQKMTDLAAACSRQGQQLLSNSVLLVNQVTDWDKERFALAEYGLPLLAIKAELDARLDAQFELQRTTLHISTALRSLSNVESAVQPIESEQAQLLQLTQQWQQIQLNPLLESLPKNYALQLTEDFSLASLQIKLRTETARLIQQRNEALLVWESDTLISLESVRSEWKKWTLNTSSLNADQQQLVARQESAYAALIAALVPVPARQNTVKHQVIEAEQVQPEEIIIKTVVDISATIAALEQALDEGSLQQALDLDKTLRAASNPVKGEQAGRLVALRAELMRLLDWAKWGGNVSREELIKVTEALLQSELAAPELAKQIGGLRARWKELDRTSGSAPRAIWERFDASCNRAYEVADAYFKQQAQIRQANLLAAQEQLSAMDVTIEDAKKQALEWKALQAYLTQVKLEWRKLGAPDRKYKARLEAEFTEKLAILELPLHEARQAALLVRQQLITAVTEIAAADRDAADQVQQAQQRWQQEALALPLDRKDEQRLWKQFRAACDAIFEQRKTNLDKQKQRRQQTQLDKQSCCEKLEQLLIENPEISQTELNSFLRSVQQEWRELSLHNRGMEARFDAAIGVLEQHLEQLERVVKQAGLLKLMEKIALCQHVENARDSDIDQDARLAQWEAAWLLSQDASAKLSGAFAQLQHVMTQRFNTGIQTLKNRSPSNPVELAANLLQLEERLLKLEILNGLPSPVELNQQRLQLQVKELQSALKNRTEQDTVTANLIALCALPVPLTVQQQQRIRQILMSVK